MTQLEQALQTLVQAYREMAPRQQAAMYQVIQRLIPAPQTAQGSAPTNSPLSGVSSIGSSALQQEQFRQTGLLPDNRKPVDVRQRVLGELGPIKQVAALDPTNRLLQEGIKMVEQAVSQS